jgi:hypothetical protein
VSNTLLSCVKFNGRVWNLIYTVCEEWPTVTLSLSLHNVLAPRTARPTFSLFFSCSERRRHHPSWWLGGDTPSYNVISLIYYCRCHFAQFERLVPCLATTPYVQFWLHVLDGWTVGYLATLRDLQRLFGNSARSAEVIWRHYAICRGDLATLRDLQRIFGDTTRSAEVIWRHCVICRGYLATLRDLQRLFGDTAWYAEVTWRHYAICRGYLATLRDLQRLFSDTARSAEAI